MKTVLITGASRGIGRAIALAFAKKRYRVVITCSKSQAELESVAQECVDLGTDCLAYVGDMGDPDTVRGLFREIRDAFGEVDVLVNNAGISYVGLLTDMSDEKWQQMLDTNLSSVFYCCREAIPGMIHEKKGKILNISSVWGNVGASCEVAYSAAKSGVNGLTKALAKELAPSNVQVNALALGMMDTQMNSCFSEEEKAELVEEIPAGRMGSAAEAAQMVLQVVESPDYLTGQIITMDGGWI